MLFEHADLYSLPVDYTPRRPEYFQVRRIVLAKGACATKERRDYVSRIIALYPDAEVENRPDSSGNKGV